MAQILQVMGHVPESLDLINDEENEEERVEETLVDSLPTASLDQRRSPQQPSHNISEISPNKQTASLQRTESHVAPIKSFSDTCSFSTSINGDAARELAGAVAAKSTVSSSSSRVSPTPEVVSVRAFEQNLGHQSEGETDAAPRKCQIETPRSDDDDDDGIEMNAAMGSKDMRNQAQSERPNAISIPDINGTKFKDDKQHESDISDDRSPPLGGCDFNGAEGDQEDVALGKEERTSGGSEGKSAASHVRLMDGQKSPAESGKSKILLDD